MKALFLRKLKTAKNTITFKKGEPADLTNYRPSSVLPCFSNVPEKLMYYQNYNYLTKNISFSKQFRFRAGHSTDHATA